ncbi:MAG: hypothetical protein HC933_15980 [Pleurocapsa sp. SU_196_0]|nr:hypothetical protein [Pleurocapsa sp. SU_196_0]
MLTHPILERRPCLHDGVATTTERKHQEHSINIFVRRLERLEVSSAFLGDARRRLPRDLEPAVAGRRDDLVNRWLRKTERA